jgi:chromosome segregation ATPase
MAVRGARNRKIETTEAQTILTSVKDLDATGVVSEVNNLQVSLQSKLANISATITDKIQQIKTIDDAIALKNQRLKELYSIEAEAIKWDDIQAQHDADKTAWEKQNETERAAWKEECAERMKVRQREEEQWLYAYNQRKARQEADLAQQISNALSDEARRHAELTRAWQEREEALKAKEVELVALREQVAGLDARVKADVSKAEAIIKNTLERQFSHERALLQKDADASKAVCEANLQHAQATVSNLESQIEQLARQLESARNDAKEVANSALQATSDRRVAEALRSVVDNRDQGPGGKSK